jgi:hypothetical protein
MEHGLHFADQSYEGLETISEAEALAERSEERWWSQKSERVSRTRIPTTSLLTFLQRNRQPPRFSDDL